MSSEGNVYFITASVCLASLFNSVVHIPSRKGLMRQPQISENI